MKRRIFILTSTLVLFLSSAALGFNVAPAPIDPSSQYSVRDIASLPTFLSGGLSLNSQVLTSTNLLNLSGSATNPNASFSYIFGTSRDDNPAIGLDFNGSGAVTYDYNLPFQVSYEAPAKALPNSTLSVNPFLELASTPTLSANQSINYGTDFFFGLSVNMPWPIPDIEVDVNQELPDLNLGPLEFNTNGSGAIGTTGSAYHDQLTSPNGYFTLLTNENSMDAWSAQGDLIAGAATMFPALTLIDSLGFDLNLGLGMSIFREDALALLNFSFEDIYLTIPETASIGSRYQQEITTTMTYDLIFQSQYDYDGNLFMNFDGPFFDPVNLFNSSLGDFDVANVNYLLLDQEIGFSFMVDIEVADPSICRESPILGLVCFDPTPVPIMRPSLGDLLPLEQASGWSPPAEAPPQIFATDEFVNLYTATTAPVPEPGTILLLGLGLAGLAFYRWKRKQA